MHVTGFIAADAKYRMEIDAEGHALVADEGPSLGGAGAGPSPFALVLAGLAACTGVTLRMYAERHDWADLAVRVELSLRLGGGRPQISRRVEVQGAPNEAGVARLRDIVERTPVTLALKSGFEIATTLEPEPA